MSEAVSMSDKYKRIVRLSIRYISLRITRLCMSVALIPCKPITLSIIIALVYDSANIKNPSFA